MIITFLSAAKCSTQGETISYWVQFVTYDSLAHEAANDSEVAAHMAQGHRNAFDEAYAAMPLMDKTSAQEAADLARLRALKRSGLLTKGERGRIFAIGLLTTIVSSALTLAIQAPFMLAGRGISGIGMSSHNDLLPSGLRLLSDIAEGMAEAFTAPLMMIAPCDSMP